MIQSFPFNISLVLLIWLISCTNEEGHEKNSIESLDTISYDEDPETFNYNDENTLYWQIHDDSGNFRIAVGIDSANCVGYCVYYFGVSTKGIVLSKEKDLDPHKTPEPIVRYIMPEEYDYDAILELIDFDAFLNMEEPKHSVDSSNINTHWYAIIDSSANEIRHFHDPGEEPEVIKPLINYLWNIVENHPNWTELKSIKPNEQG